MDNDGNRQKQQNWTINGDKIGIKNYLPPVQVSSRKKTEI